MFLRLECERGLLTDDHSIPLAVGKCCFETLRTAATPPVAMCLGKAECESSVSDVSLLHPKGGSFM